MRCNITDNSNKLDISIQNFDLITNNKINELETKLEEQHQENMSRFLKLDSFVETSSKDFNAYKDFVDNVYLKIPKRMGWFRKLLFKIIFEL